MEEKKHKNSDDLKIRVPSFKLGKISKGARENPWLVSTVVLIILVIALLVNGTGGMTGNAVSATEAGEHWAEFFSENYGEDITVTDVQYEDGLYLVSFDYSGGESGVYVTLDGENFVYGTLVPIGVEGTDSGETQSQDVPTSDVPDVELYIWSYCPYGVTALSPFAEVASLLGDYANFNVHLYYAGHGEHELQQNKIQACIQDLSYEEEYWEYAQRFVQEIYPECSGDVDCDLEKSTALMNSIGIDSDEVLSCVESRGDDLYAADSAAAKAAGVSGSPTLAVNGVIVNAARNAESFKSVICSAFNNAPSECSQELDSSSAQASGSC